MTQSTAKLTLIAAGIYILSQVILIFTIGKDIELILLSFGVFIASVVFIFAFQGFAPGRVKLESVSMRRANAEKDVQAEMQEKGYVIDDEFLSKNPFRNFARKKTPTFEYTHHNDSGFDSIDQQTQAKPSLEKLIWDNAGLYGGIEKMKSMLDKMDDKTIEKMAKQMGFHDHSASQIRQTVSDIHQQPTPSKKAEANGYGADRTESCHPKVSLDSNSFNDYIKRCMTGEQEKNQNEHQIDFFEDFQPQVFQAPAPEVEPEPTKGIPPKVLKRMRGIHASNGGKMKCENCANLDRQNQVCSSANVPVELLDVCNAWQPGAAIG